MTSWSEKCDADWTTGGHSHPVPSPATHRGTRAVLPPLRDLSLVGVVGAADHGTGRGQPAAPAACCAAARLSAWQSLLLQLCVPRAGRAALGMQWGRRWAAWKIQGSGCSRGRLRNLPSRLMLSAQDMLRMSSKLSLRVH
jgi:hypothetical protein